MYIHSQIYQKELSNNFPTNFQKCSQQFNFALMDFGSVSLTVGLANIQLNMYFCFVISMYFYWYTFGLKTISLVKYGSSYEFHWHLYEHQDENETALVSPGKGRPAWTIFLLARSKDFSDFPPHIEGQSPMQESTMSTETMKKGCRVACQKNRYGFEVRYPK